MDEYGLSCAHAQALNPGIVHCSVTGFGVGEGAALPGSDLLLQAVGGLMSAAGPAPGRPVRRVWRSSTCSPDRHAAAGGMAALRHRDATGDGRHVEVDPLSSLLLAPLGVPR